MNYGKLIREYRLKNNLTQKKLAELIHVSDKTIAKWEMGVIKPSSDVLINISKVLDMPLENSDNKKVKTGKPLYLVGGIFLIIIDVIFGIYCEKINIISSGFMIIIALTLFLLAFAFITYFVLNINKKSSNLSLKFIIISGVIATFIFGILSIISKSVRTTWLVWLIYIAVLAFGDIVKDIRNEEEEN